MTTEMKVTLCFSDRNELILLTLLVSNENTEWITPGETKGPSSLVSCLLQQPESIAEEHPEPEPVALIIYNPWWVVDLLFKHVQAVLKSTTFCGN